MGGKSPAHTTRAAATTSAAAAPRLLDPLVRLQLASDRAVRVLRRVDVHVEVLRPALDPADQLALDVLLAALERAFLRQRRSGPPRWDPYLSRRAPSAPVGVAPPR